MPGRQAFEAASLEAPALRAELPERLTRVISRRLRVTAGELQAAVG